MLVLSSDTNQPFFFHCYRPFTYCTNDPQGEQYSRDWVHSCGDNWWPTTADPTLSSVHAHLPPHSGWEPGGDHADPAGLSSPHSHVRLPQPPLPDGLWLLHSRHSQSDGWIPHGRQGNFLPCLCCSVFLLCCLSPYGNFSLGLNGLWPSCSSVQATPLHQHHDTKGVCLDGRRVLCS